MKGKRVYEDDITKLYKDTNLEIIIHNARKEKLTCLETKVLIIDYLKAKFFKTPITSEQLEKRESRMKGVLRLPKIIKKTGKFKDLPQEDTYYDQ